MPVLSICNLTPCSFWPPVPVYLLCSIYLTLFLSLLVSPFVFIYLATSLLSFLCLSFPSSAHVSVPPFWAISLSSVSADRRPDGWMAR